MKKKNLALILIAAMSAVTISTVVPSTYNQIFADLSGDPDCAYLESTCTSLAQIIDENYHSTDHANGKSYEKTWGTVSAIYTQSNYYHAFIQSTSSYGTAGICLYRVSPTSMGCPLKVGDFVYASGTMTFYNGMYELEIRNSSGALIDGNSFTVDETMTSYDIETYEIPSEEASATPVNETEWEKINMLGNVRVSLEDLTITSRSTSEAKATTTDGYEVVLYYNSIGEKSNISDKIYDIYVNGSKHVNVTGYLTAFDNGSKFVAEILIRYADDIVEVTSGDTIDVTNITINGDYSSYGYGDKFYLNYSVYPENATNKEVTFDSTNYNVADVSAYGFVEIIGFGTATIRASSVSNPDVYDEIEIVVETSSDTITSIDITLDPDKVYVDSEDGFERNWVDIPVNVATHVGQISLSPSTASANQLGVDVFSYEIYDSCNDISVQITDELDLILTASKSGQYEIVVYDVDQYWVYDYFEVNVAADYATDFSINPTSYTLDIDDTFSITPTAIPAGNILPTVKYQSMDEDVATVSSTGVVTAVGKGTTDIRVSIDNFETYKTCTVTVTEPEYKYTIDFSSMSTGSYSTNFGRKTVSGIEYGYYRAKSSYSGYWRFYPSANLTSATTYSLPGAFYNDDPTYAITSLEITYEGVGVVKYGNHKNSLSSTALSSSSSKTTVTVDTNSSFYWYVEATTGTLDIYSIVAKYDHSKPVTGMYTPADRQDVRIPATTYSGALVDGVSYVNVPNDITISGTNYTVNSYKKLTYYSFDYVQEHSDSLDLDAIALTDPSDVAAYYIAFGCAPVNYYALNSVSAVDSKLGSDSEVYNLFGEDARCVSQYNRTDGYAVGIPYNGSKPVYLEFDFASNSSYSANPDSKSRDVSRVVIWTGGWNGYETAPVATMTDDHYVTFREFNNAYGWNEPFDSIENGNYTSSRTGYNYGSTTTLTAK